MNGGYTLGGLDANGYQWWYKGTVDFNPITFIVGASNGYLIYRSTSGGDWSITEYQNTSSPTSVFSNLDYNKSHPSLCTLSWDTFMGASGTPTFS